MKQNGANPQGDEYGSVRQLPRITITEEDLMARNTYGLDDVVSAEDNTGRMLDANSSGFPGIQTIQNNLGDTFNSFEKLPSVQSAGGNLGTEKNESFG